MLTTQANRTAAIPTNRLVILLLCVGFPALLAASIFASANGAIKALDFGAFYYQARCALRHNDPYNPEVVLREFLADGGRFPETTVMKERMTRTAVILNRNLPTMMLVVAPISMLPWPLALMLWLAAIGALSVVASFLMWDLASDAPVMAGCMASFMLLNSAIVLTFGCSAGIVVPLCVIAAWCFLRDRFAAAGVVMLALALAIKPHDAGWVWLYFLLTPGGSRKRALQTLAVTVALGVCAAAWIATCSPHWPAELRTNLSADLVPGSVNDPGPTGPTNRGFAPVIDLQNTISVFRNDPGFYNPLSYGIAGGMILVWIVVVLRKRVTRAGTLLALAAISNLTLLPIYHRPYDARLLLLAIPACAMMWKGGGARRWVALCLTSAAIFVTSDIPLIFWTAATAKVTPSLSSLSGKLTLLGLEPAPLILLVAGCFYLWVYIRYQPSAADPSWQDAQEAAAAAAG